MNRIPQGGLRRPKPKHPPTLATTTIERIDRQKDGTYRLWHSKEDRYCKPMQVGVAQICVMNEYGFLVVIKQEAMPWY
ncbi:hypothetical protein ACLS0R_11620 [Comamonas jiangduensis]|uniref:hypothetical protein n=1 Tax=Comamonas jiangduensis TaxID=1194168 RepID=UPI001C5614FC|nr:hypothetical protein KXJ72_11345 [Comamonas aquatica]